MTHDENPCEIANDTKQKMAAPPNNFRVGPSRLSRFGDI